jgi:4-(gamma-glutamylamino)butanal dehydrogenase
VTTTASWSALAAEVRPRTDLLVDGDWVPSASGERLSVVSPVDGSVVAEVACADGSDVDRAVAAARRAFEDRRWAGMAPRERKEVLVRWSQLCAEHADELAVLHTMEMGKPAREARAVDLRAVVRTVGWFGEAIDKLVDEIPHTEESALALVTREPAGVVGAVVPWNFPLTMAAWKVAPALAAGCSVVLKPAENSPLSALRFAELAHEAGLPDGVLNVVNGLGVVAGQALGRHHDVDVLTFTGSTAVGRAFLNYSSESNLKRVWLELGGKSPNIVFPDADLELAATTAAWSIFYNQGEMCTAGSRLLVHESVHDEVVARVLAAATKTQPANPYEDDAPMGALVSSTHLDRVHGMVTKARHDSGELLVGGEPVLVETGGSYYPPTVFDRVPGDASLFQQEVFGPVLAVTTFRGDAEAVALANATRYGLAAAVWTDDVNRAHRMSRALRVGVVWVNCYEEGDLTVPFGGVKESGFGRDKSLHALDKFLDLKTTWLQLR